MKKLVYIFDDINYQSGAQKSTLFQIECLNKRYDIYIFSLTKPNLQMHIPGNLIDLEEIWNDSEIYTKRFKEVIFGNYRIIKKIMRIFYTISIRFGISDKFMDFFLYKNVAKCLDIYDVAIVVSEASRLRELIGKLSYPRKIQWIHTDYEQWSNYSSWTRNITKNDKLLYSKYDYIVVLSEACKRGLVKSIPTLIDKIIVIPNLINTTEILSKSMENTDVYLSPKDYNFITVGRLDKEKNYDRLIKISNLLKIENVEYTWYIIGEGPLKDYIKKQIVKFNLQDNILLLGHIDNPYPIMKQCDYFVLLSDYEGTPVTIDEAAALGVEVISTPVGGVPEQLHRYGGTLLDMSGDIFRDFKKALMLEKSDTKVDVTSINEMILLKLIQIIQD